MSVYVTRTASVPGYPSSPSLLVYVSTTPALVSFRNGSARHTTLSNP